MEYYLGQLQGNYFLMVFALTLILLLPVPTSPALVYFMISFGPVTTLSVYLTASTINSAVIFVFGKVIAKFGHFYKTLKWLRFFLLSHGCSPRLKYCIINGKRAANQARRLLEKSTVLDVAVVRFSGLHNHVIMFTLGLLSMRPLNAFVVNTVFVFIDVAVYWVILGPGMSFLQYIFPDFAFANFMQKENISRNLFIVTIFVYLIYLIYRLTKKKRGL